MLRHRHILAARHVMIQDPAMKHQLMHTELVPYRIALVAKPSWLIRRVYDIIEELWDIRSLNSAGNSKCSQIR